MQKLGIIISSIYLNFVPIFAVLIIAILGTPPRLLQIAGGALVLIGVFLSQRHHFAWYRRITGAAGGGARTEG
jgi:drug/metabolite transporter (DMT)-like permease